MPLLKHAKKKLKQDKVRTTRNRRVKDLFKSLIKKAKASKTPEAVSAAFSGIDKAAKQNILHKNKAARLKSALTKAVAETGEKAAEVKKTVKKTVKKAAPKKSSSKKK